ncbi:hypothetical protein [Sphingopyxis kveilinensis]
MSRTITGWRLPQSERERLLKLFEPIYSEIGLDPSTGGLAIVAP